jgi:hypothetical protein
LLLLLGRCVYKQSLYILGTMCIQAKLIYIRL